MYIHNLDPTIVDFGLFTLRWYSLAYIFGIILGWWLGKKIILAKFININFEDFEDLISYLIISIIIGGRIGYIFFYNLNYYFLNPIEIFKIWEGGMSFHGALVGIIIATYVFSKKKNIKTFIFLDIIACVAPIGLFFGRIANFINGELYGKPSEVMWSVIFPDVDNIPRHPSQIYEAFFEGIVLFTILIFFMFKKKYKTGTCSALFLVFYGIFRIFIEQFREPDSQIGYLFNSLSMGSILSALMLICGLLIIFKINKNDFK